ncbi:hypothetical protein [Caulobacter phage RLK]|nr:hypothetical protein [Caulobacter phage RLK]
MTADLIARLEAAESGSRELDVAIAQAIAKPTTFLNYMTFDEAVRDFPHDLVNIANNWPIPHFSASIDASVALIGEKLPGWFFGLQENRWSKEPEQTERRWSAYLSPPTYDPEEPEIEVTHRDRYLSCCIALLRALSTQPVSGGVADG